MLVQAILSQADGCLQDVTLDGSACLLPSAPSRPLPTPHAHRWRLDAAVDAWHA